MNPTIRLLRHDAYLLAFNTARCVLTGAGYGVGIFFALRLIGIISRKG